MISPRVECNRLLEDRVERTATSGLQFKRESETDPIVASLIEKRKMIKLNPELHTHKRGDDNGLSGKRIGWRYYIANISRLLTMSKPRSIIFTGNYLQWSQLFINAVNIPSNCIPCAALLVQLSLISSPSMRLSTSQHIVQFLQRADCFVFQFCFGLNWTATDHSFYDRLLLFASLFFTGLDGVAD